MNAEVELGLFIMDAVRLPITVVIGKLTLLLLIGIFCVPLEFVTEEIAELPPVTTETVDVVVVTETVEFAGKFVKLGLRVVSDDAAKLTAEEDEVDDDIVGLWDRLALEFN